MWTAKVNPYYLDIESQLKKFLIPTTLTVELMVYSEDRYPSL